jgi:hypothetical protein
VKNKGREKMSKRGSIVSRHRKDNYSLDIKGILKTSMIYTPINRKKEENNKYLSRIK